MALGEFQAAWAVSPGRDRFLELRFWADNLRSLIVTELAQKGAGHGCQLFEARITTATPAAQIVDK